MNQTTIGWERSHNPFVQQIVAAMRKLLTILNAMLRDQNIWDATRHTDVASRA